MFLHDSLNTILKAQQQGERQGLDEELAAGAQVKARELPIPYYQF